MKVIDGKKTAQEILARLKTIKTPEKILAVIQIGENPASESFIRQKEKIAKELRVDFRLYKFKEDISQDELRKEVLKIANHKMTGGVIVQLPLPKHINNQYVLNVIPREKDIDVLGERALGAFYAGRNLVLPPAVATVQEILQTINYKLQTANVAVVGLGQLVGKPTGVWLIKKCKELYLLDSESDLAILKQADLVICGVGKAGLIKSEMLKDGAAVIDFGYERSEPSSVKTSEGQGEGKIAGDFNPSGLVASGYSLTTNFYTPTPGGTGPVLVAKIFENFYTLNNESR